MNILGFGTGIATLLLDNTDTTGVSGSLINQASYAQESIQINNTMTAGTVGIELGDTNYNLWLSANVLHESGDWVDKDLIIIKDNEGTAWVKVVANSDATYLIAYFDGSSWIESPSSSYTDANALHRLDLEYSADAVRLYIDGTLDLEMVTTITQATATLLTAEFYNPHSESTAHSYWSSVFAADTSTRKTVMNQHTLTADGTLHSAFNGTYDDVDDFATLGETTTINTEFGNTLHTFQKDAVPTELADGYTVTAVGLYARAVENSEVTSSLQTVMDDGTNQKLGDLVSTPSTFTTIKQIEPNAQDGDFWTVAKLDSAEFGIKCVV